jgi:hypothetical protein
MGLPNQGGGAAASVPVIRDGRLGQRSTLAEWTAGSDQIFLARILLLINITAFHQLQAAILLRASLPESFAHQSC